MTSVIWEKQGFKSGPVHVQMALFFLKDPYAFQRDAINNRAPCSSLSSVRLLLFLSLSLLGASERKRRARCHPPFERAFGAPPPRRIRRARRSTVIVSVYNHREARAVRSRQSDAGETFSAKVAVLKVFTPPGLINNSSTRLNANFERHFGPGGALHRWRDYLN